MPFDSLRLCSAAACSFNGSEHACVRRDARVHRAGLASGRLGARAWMDQDRSDSRGPRRQLRFRVLDRRGLHRFAQGCRYQDRRGGWRLSPDGLARARYVQNRSREFRAAFQFRGHADPGRRLVASFFSDECGKSANCPIVTGTSRRRFFIFLDTTSVWDSGQTDPMSQIETVLRASIPSGTRRPALLWLPTRLSTTTQGSAVPRRA